MKKIILFITLLAFSLTMKSQNDKKQKFISDITKNTTCIFEGNVISTEQAFYSKTGNIFTLIKVKVEKINFGNAESSEILIAKSGGTIGNREEISSHGNMISDYNTFFLNTEFMVIDASTNKSYYALSNIAYDDNYNIIGNENAPFKNYNDFYSELSKKISVTFEKKSPVEKYVKEKVKEEIEISYETKSKNFKDLIELKTNLINNSIQLKTSLVNDLTLRITNPTLTGSLYEFDINIRADNNSTYLDNVPVWITYNTAVFNSSVVAVNNVTVTNGTNFNNSNYYPANSFMQDNSANTMIFLVSAIVSADSSCVGT